MPRNALVYALPGVMFGLLVGWIIGSQHEAPAPVASATTTTAAASPASEPPPPPLDVQQANALEQTAKADPKNSAVRAQLGDLYYDAKRFDVATTWYEQALALDPKSVDVSTDLAVCYFYTNQVDRALAQIDKSLAINPQHPKTLFNQGIVRAYGKEDLKGATDSWQKLVAIAPDSVEGRQAKQLLDGLKSHPSTTGAPASTAPTGRGGTGTN
jgi:cytochrome c-type biogenesis protein CcmH/NrfG